MSERPGFPASTVVILRSTVSCIGAILLGTGLSKSVSYPVFESAVAGYPLVSEELATWIAPAVLSSELVIGGALVACPEWRVWIRYAAFLLVIFLIAQSVAIVQGGVDTCGCGLVGGPVSPATMLVTGGLAATAVACSVVDVAKGWPSGHVPARLLDGDPSCRPTPPDDTAGGRAEAARRPWRVGTGAGR